MPPRAPKVTQNRKRTIADLEEEDVEEVEEEPQQHQVASRGPKVQRTKDGPVRRRSAGSAQILAAEFAAAMRPTLDRVADSLDRVSTCLFFSFIHSFFIIIVFFISISRTQKQSPTW